MSAHHKLVALWDKAVGSPTYNKEDWIEIGNELLRLQRLEKYVSQIREAVSERRCGCQEVRDILDRII